MSAFMLVTRRAGWLTEQAPKTITRRAHERIDSGFLQGRQLDISTAILHLGFGGAVGAVYANTPGLSSARPMASVLKGALFGACLWVVAYWGILPGLGLMPPPPEDQRKRPVVMLLAHLIYGGVLGALVGRTPRPVTDL